MDRRLLVRLVATTAIACLSATSFAQPPAAPTPDQQVESQSSPAPAEEPSREELIKRLEKTLTGAHFDGQFTIEGKKEQIVPGGDETYTITSARKLPEGDLWLLKARVKYGKTDTVVPLPIEIKWAGDTPVITMTRFTIPEMGTFSARVVLYEGRYAGTWQHDSVGGHLIGAIRPATDKEKAAAEKPAEKKKANDQFPNDQ